MGNGKPLLDKPSPETKQKPLLSLEREAISLLGCFNTKDVWEVRRYIGVILGMMKNSTPQQKSDMAAILKLLRPPPASLNDNRANEGESGKSCKALEKLSDFVDGNTMSSEVIRALKYLVENTVKPYGTAPVGNIMLPLAVNVPLKGDLSQTVRAIALLDTVIHGESQSLPFTPLPNPKELKDLPEEGQKAWHDVATQNASLIRQAERRMHSRTPFEPGYLTPEYVKRLLFLNTYNDDIRDKIILPAIKSPEFVFSISKLVQIQDDINKHLEHLSLKPKKTEQV